MASLSIELDDRGRVTLVRGIQGELRQDTLASGRWLTVREVGRDVRFWPEHRIGRGFWSFRLDGSGGIVRQIFDKRSDRPREARLSFYRGPETYTLSVRHFGCEFPTHRTRNRAWRRRRVA